MGREEKLECAPAIPLAGLALPRPVHGGRPPPSFRALSLITPRNSELLHLPPLDDRLP